MFRSLSFSCASPTSVEEPCVSPVSFFCRRRGWTFRATKKDTLSAAGSPRNTLEFRPPARSIESACFSSSGKTILPSYYCWSGNCSGVRRDLANPHTFVLSFSFPAPCSSCRPKRNFFRIHRVRGKRDLSLAALFVTDSPPSTSAKDFHYVNRWIGSFLVSFSFR